MVNEVTKIFSEMTDLELSQAIREMKEDGPQGIIREGVVREKCKMVNQIVGGNVYEHLMMTQFSILQEASYRFTPNIDLLPSKTHTMSEDSMAKDIDTQSKNLKDFSDIFEKIEDLTNLPFPNEDVKAGAIKALNILRNYILNREK